MSFNSNNNSENSQWSSYSQKVNDSKQALKDFSSKIGDAVDTDKMKQAVDTDKMKQATSELKNRVAPDSSTIAKGKEAISDVASKASERLSSAYNTTAEASKPLTEKAGETLANVAQVGKQKLADAAYKVGDVASQAGATTWEKAKDAASYVAETVSEKTKQAASVAGEKLSEWGEAASEKAGEVAKQGKNAAEDVADKAANKASEWSQKAKEAGSEAANKASEAGSKAANKASEAGATVYNKATEAASQGYNKSNDFGKASRSATEETLNTARRSVSNAATPSLNMNSTWRSAGRKLLWIGGGALAVYSIASYAPAAFSRFYSTKKQTVDAAMNTMADTKSWSKENNSKLPSYDRESSSTSRGDSAPAWEKPVRQDLNPNDRTPTYGEKDPARPNYEKQSQSSSSNKETASGTFGQARDKSPTWDKPVRQDASDKSYEKTSRSSDKPSSVKQDINANDLQKQKQADSTSKTERGAPAKN